MLSGVPVLLLALALSGCATLEAINPWTSENLEAQRAASAGRPASGTTPAVAAARTAPAATAAPNSADPLLRLVATMPPTGEQSFREPVTGETLKVRVLRSYTAASGRACREYQVLTVRDERQVRVACAGTDGWVQAKRLRQEAGAPGTGER